MPGPQARRDGEGVVVLVVMAVVTCQLVHKERSSHDSCDNAPSSGGIGPGAQKHRTPARHRCRPQPASSQGISTNTRQTTTAHIRADQGRRRLDARYFHKHKRRRQRKRTRKKTTEAEKEGEEGRRNVNKSLAYSVAQRLGHSSNA